MNKQEILELMRVRSAMNQSLDCIFPWVKNVEPLYKANIILSKIPGEGYGLDWWVLKDYLEDVLFVGNSSDRDDFQKHVGACNFPCYVTDWQEMAALIKGAKIFVGSLDIPYVLAEIADVPRVLDASLDCGFAPRTDKGHLRLTRSILDYYLFERGDEPYNPIQYRRNHQINDIGSAVNVCKEPWKVINKRPLFGIVASSSGFNQEITDAFLQHMEKFPDVLVVVSEDEDTQLKLSYKCEMVCVMDVGVKPSREFFRDARSIFERKPLSVAMFGDRITVVTNRLLQQFGKIDIKGLMKFGYQVSCPAMPRTVKVES